MDTIFLDEKTDINSIVEKRTSAASSCDIALHEIPGPPDELSKFVKQGSTASITITHSDGTEAMKCDSVDNTTKDYFARPEILTPTISRASISTVEDKNAVLKVEIDQSLTTSTPPPSIHRTSEPSIASDQTPSPSNTNNKCAPKTTPSQFAPSKTNEYPSELAVCSQSSENQNGKKMRETEASQTGTRKIELHTPDIQAIATIGRVCYISNTALAPEEFRAHWTTTLKTQIDNTLPYELPPSNDNQSSLVLVLCMAGTRRKDLKPSILVTCCQDNKKRGKAVMKVLSQMQETGRLRGPHGDDMPYFVRVQGGFKPLMAGQKMQKQVIEARIEASQCTIGVSARMRSTAALDGENMDVKFTLGGIICIDKRDYYLTAAHPFLPSEHDRTDDLDSSLSSTLGRDISDTDSVEGEDVEESNTFRLSDDDIQAPPLAVLENVGFNILEHDGIFTRVNSPYTCQLENTQPGQLGTSDWAVVLLANGDASYSSLAVNSIHTPGDDNPISIEETMAASEMRADWVWIATGRGLHNGFLNPTPASILIRHSICEVKQIALSSPLVEGDSGSWVIQDGKLCGMVVAGSYSPPYAYMVLAEDILSDIANCSPETIKVSLPERIEPGSRRSRSSAQRPVNMESAGPRTKTCRESSHSSLLIVEGGVVRETSSSNPGQAHFEVSETVDIPLRNMRHNTKTTGITPDIPIHSRQALPQGKIKALFSQLSRGLMGKVKAQEEDTSNVPKPYNQARRARSKKVRHYPRFPAQSPRKVGAASNTGQGLGFQSVLMAKKYVSTLISRFSCGLLGTIELQENTGSTPNQARPARNTESMKACHNPCSPTPRRDFRLVLSDW
ncbi:hypothetical protein N431DRAFT_464311 [Stipitochalara longipes BDJ]|nr:hypothetical protein N431DRAFT_464311 [Stipitochalara longipes BDJ]